MINIFTFFRKPSVEYLQAQDKFEMKQIENNIATLELQTEELKHEKKRLEQLEDNLDTDSGFIM